jgi:hypothetical protein
MSTSKSGTTYTYVSGSTITAGGASNTMGGGRGIVMLISISAMVGIGTTIANAKRIVPKKHFFILMPPYLIFSRKQPSAPYGFLIPPFHCAG